MNHPTFVSLLTALLRWMVNESPAASGTAEAHVDPGAILLEHGQHQAAGIDADGALGDRGVPGQDGQLPGAAELGDASGA